MTTLRTRQAKAGLFTRLSPNRTLPHLTTACLTEPNQAPPNRAMPYVSKPYRILPDSALPCRAQPYHTTPHYSKPYRALPYLTRPHSAIPDPASPNLTPPDRIMSKSTFASLAAKAPWRLHQTAACYARHLLAAHGTQGRATGDCQHDWTRHATAV